MSEWHLLTGEYPPQPGGVSDYTRSVARGLASTGDSVSIWAPPLAAPQEEIRPPELDDDGVTVHRLADCFGRASLHQIGASLDQRRSPCRILVQYVPHAFGWKAMNVPFCRWLGTRSRDSVWVMFHEVAFPIDRRQTLAQNVLGIVTRRMASLVARSAGRVFVSIPAWEPVLRQLAPSTAPIEWLPVPSAIPVVDDAPATARIRAGFADGGQAIVGHFGTYGVMTRPLLEDAMVLLLESSDCRVLLLGRGGDGVAASVVNRVAAARGRVHGTGALSARDVSVHLAACDVMMQPYPDGISSRRTSAMAGLAHGKTTVTTDGALTETLWRESAAVTLCPPGDARALASSAAMLAADPTRRARLGRDASSLYDARFDIRHTIAALAHPAGVLLGAAS